jgi:putative ABC transport system ATP-binding protein
MPDTTKIFIENNVLNPESYDMFVEINNGRIDGAAQSDEPQDQDARQDLNRKLKAIAQAELFGNLDLKQQRLLAFSSQWLKVKAGQEIFKAGQTADAAFLCVKGLGGLYWPAGDEKSLLITEIARGRLIGDLAVILNDTRPLDLTAIEDSIFLRIGATELMAVIENDALVATSLLRAVSGNLKAAAEGLRATREFAVERGVNFEELDNLRRS